MMRAHRDTRSGFTLLETMIALSILAVGLLGMAALQIQALEYSSRGRHGTQAASIAENQIEELMRRRWTNLAPTGWTAPIQVLNQVQAGGSVTEQSYDVSWRITDVVAGVTRNVDVRVSWTESSGRTRSYALSSMRFNQEGL